MFLPIVTLTTDFGLSDHYVAAMKGVILSRCPRAQIIDVSHEVEPFSILAGAYTIDQAARWFPPKTVHVVVVDPGVGTDRRPIALEAGGSRFIAPDNGVLSLVIKRAKQFNARELTHRRLRLQPVSETFHGRDIFAPAAATLAAGAIDFKLIGPPVSDPVLLAGLEPVETAAGNWLGQVLSVDQFGNVVTSFDAGRFGSAKQIEAGAEQIGVFHKTFGEANHAEPFVYAGSSGFLEIGINQGSAADRLGLGLGAPVNLRMRD